jgi:hypothetical protein
MGVTPSLPPQSAWTNHLVDNFITLVSDRCFSTLLGMFGPLKHSYCSVKQSENISKNIIRI